jgi:hypothetical protein
MLCFDTLIDNKGELAIFELDLLNGQNLLQ